jgi:thymidylate synthase
MIQTIYGRNVPEAYLEGLWKLQVSGVEEDSRNGPVLTIAHPVMLEIERPWERVLFDPVRDANPFFHVMEFVWMMAGSNDAEWIAQFNKRMLEYSDDGVLRGAYGWRWKNGHQIEAAVRLLRDNPNTRQCVLQMWDFLYDGPRASTSDRPCNTHIYFRTTPEGRLDMTVCNRSNDFFWGMLGSNAVHFTMLHELMASATGFLIGEYRVFSNNLHVYKEMPGFDEKFNHRVKHDPYTYDDVRTQPLLDQGENFEDFMADAYQMVEYGFEFEYQTEWFRTVASPIHDAYLDKSNRDHYMQGIGAPDWYRVCQEWCARRKAVL